VSEFVLERALVRADETLTIHPRFGLGADRWQSFMTALDAPARALPLIARSFHEPSAFDVGSTQ
jgi:uncharacterized protein (DUF1778 family)